MEWRRDFLPEHISFVNQYPSALDVVAERRSVDAVPAADGHHCHIFSYSACSARHTVWSGAEDPGLNPVAGLRPTRRLKRPVHPGGHRCGVPQFPRSLAGKPLAGFRATPDRRIPVLYGMVVYAIRFNNQLLHRQPTLRKRRLGENRGFRPSF